MTTVATDEQVLEETGTKEPGGIKVFLIEDDKLIRELVVTKLSQKGCIPYSTHDGGEAIMLTEQYKPDAIILDLMLPGMTGEEILEGLKKRDDLKSIPVVIFSNKSAPEDKKRALELGADRYFVKAETDLNELVSVLKLLVKQAAE